MFKGGWRSFILTTPIRVVITQRLLKIFLRNQNFVLVEEFVKIVIFLVKNE